MERPTIVIEGEKYELATNLMVAYKMQAANDHKPYATVFQELFDTETPVEKQVSVIFIACKVANPGIAERYTEQQFVDLYLNNYNYRDMMTTLQKISQGVMGVTDEEMEEMNSKATDKAEDSAPGKN